CTGKMASQNEKGKAAAAAHHHAAACCDDSKESLATDPLCDALGEMDDVDLNALGVDESDAYVRARLMYPRSKYLRDRLRLWIDGADGAVRQCKAFPKSVYDAYCLLATYAETTIQQDNPVSNILQVGGRLTRCYITLLPLMSVPGFAVFAEAVQNSA